MILEGISGYVNDPFGEGNWTGWTELELKDEDVARPKDLSHPSIKRKVEDDGNDERTKQVRTEQRS